MLTCCYNRIFLAKEDSLSIKLKKLHVLVITWPKTKYLFLSWSLFFIFRLHSCWLCWRTNPKCAELLWLRGRRSTFRTKGVTAPSTWPVASVTRHVSSTSHHRYSQSRWRTLWVQGITDKPSHSHRNLVWRIMKVRNKSFWIFVCVYDDWFV